MEHRGMLNHRGRDLAKREGWLVDDRSGVTAEEIVRSVRRAKERNKTALVVVDYIQLVKASFGDKRHEQLGHSMQVFADAAKQDRMAYVVLSQLNRECEKRDNKRPLLGDLKASGDIEEKAKAVLMLYRPAVYEDDTSDELVEILIRKNNHGSTGFVEAKWDAKTIRIH